MNGCLYLLWWMKTGAANSRELGQLIVCYMLYTAIRNGFCNKVIAVLAVLLYLRFFF